MEKDLFFWQIRKDIQEEFSHKKFFNKKNYEKGK